MACANEAGKADSNGSQFFITTERCDHLDRQNTIFGRVSGDTIFTVLRIQEVEVDDHDRPADPPTITSCEVLLPPFDDIVPRVTPEERRAKAAAAVEAKRLADVRERKQHGTILEYAFHLTGPLDWLSFVSICLKGGLHVAAPWNTTNVVFHR